MAIALNKSVPIEGLWGPASHQPLSTYSGIGLRLGWFFLEKEPWETLIPWFIKIWSAARLGDIHSEQTPIDY